MISWTIVAVLVMCVGALDPSRSPRTPGTRCSEFARLSTSEERVISVRGQERVISVRGQERSVLVYWSEGPARAAAALLHAVLRHKLHYSSLRLKEGPRDLCQLTGEMGSQRDEELLVVPAAAWNRHRPCKEWESCDLYSGSCGLAGPRLMVIGPGAAPLEARAHVYLSTTARSLPECAQANSWSFYGNESALGHCSFDFFKNTGLITMYVTVETPWNVTEARALIENIISASVPVRLEPLNRTLLTDQLRNPSSRSFLFLDWAMWQRLPGVTPMSEARCACTQLSCLAETEVLPVRAASETLAKYAPSLFQLLRKFTPEPEALREIFELEARHTRGDIEEAACQWAIDHQARINNWVHGTSRFDYYALVYVCMEDSKELPHLRNVINLLGAELWRVTKKYNFGINIPITYINCSNQDNIVGNLDTLTHSSQSYRVIGIVAAGMGATALAEGTKARQLPLVAYDLNTEDTHATVGGVMDLAAVLRNFFTECGWARVAVLSEPNQPVRRLLVKKLTEVKRLCVQDVQLNTNHAERSLKELKWLDARVVLLNMRAEMAAMVIAMAERLHMTPAQGYAWVSVEWGAAPPPRDMRVFVVSGECREGHNDSHATLRRRFDETFINPSAMWPPHVAALADALLTLGYGYMKLRHSYSQYKDDLHGKDYLRLFWEGLAATNITGVCQNLRYEDGALAESLVFVDEWSGHKREPLNVWRVHRGKTTLVWQRVDYPTMNMPHDGHSQCIIQSGNCFVPNCHDVQWAIGGTALLLAIVLMAFAAVQARRAITRRLQKYEAEIRQTLPGRREQTLLSLAEYLVPRDQLELREQLGEGCSGRVHLALLRTPARKLRAVAAKSLREDAAPSEESEFLREACTLAALDHVHVVRLVGVCTGDPLLVLMEHAFFGDLVGYLRARRHLAEGADLETTVEEGDMGPEEASHVSAEALTRLMREAASALAYLAHRGLVHRDVRAANCLVDARRSLKLGDFGMARETRDSGADGDAEYACRRRGLFPVMWMAPESLERGAFSAASDVWSLGVLMLEVVTLGARPYGSWSPLRVLEYVSRGGRPQLPLDATAQTRGVALSCWRRAARERPSASELVAYLADHPRALRPALTVDCDTTDEESGYGEPDGNDATESTHSSDTFDQPSPDSCTAFFPD